MTIVTRADPATPGGLVLFLAAIVLTGAAPASAQGPLTGALPEEPPTVAAYQIGPVQLRPTLNISELGVDSNVFDEPVDPKRDYMLVLNPTVSAFLRSGVLQFVVLSGTDFTYYRTYESERSIGRQLRGRLDFLLSRVRPSVGAALVDSRTRPNPEIDLRARRSEREVSGSVGFELSPLARLYAGVARVDTTFNNGQVFRGVDLADALNRRGQQVGGGARISLTPFTTLTIDTTLSRDRFAARPERDSDSLFVTSMVAFSRDAVVSGSLKVGYRDFRPKDVALDGFRGLVTTVNLSYTAFWRGRLAFTAERDVQYSFEEAEGYFVGTSGDLVYTQRILGPFDVQGRAGIGRMNYGNRAGADARVDTAHTYAAGVGYNRDDGSRIGLTYEYGTRKSDERPDRRFTRRRLYGSLTYTF